jgi:hypothetical protein
VGPHSKRAVRARASIFDAPSGIRCLTRILVSTILGAKSKTMNAIQRNHHELIIGIEISVVR